MLTFEKLPQAVEDIQAQLADLRDLLNSRKPTGTEDAIFSAEDAAKFTKRSLATIYRQVSNREIPFHKNGNRLYFFKSELIDWIKNRSK